MPWVNGYNYRCLFTFNVRPASDLTAFPNLVLGTYSQLADVAHGGYVNNTVTLLGQTVPADLIFTSDSAGSVLLSWEIESWNNVTGAIVAWINSDRLAASDTLIYCWVGKSSVTTYQCTASATWSTSYAIVQHFPNGSSLSLADSKGVYSSVNSSAVPTVGKLDGGVAMSGGQYYSITNGSNSISGNNTNSVSVWVKSSSFGNSPLIWSIASTGDVFGEANASGTQILQGYRVVAGVSPYAIWNADISDGNWHLLHFIKTGITSGQLYLDGNPAVLASGSISAMPTITGYVLSVGAYSTGFTWQGALDEFRVVTTNLSADWIAHEYRQQAQASAWYTIGSWLAGGGSSSLALLGVGC